MEQIGTQILYVGSYSEPFLSYQWLELAQNLCRYNNDIYHCNTDKEPITSPNTSTSGYECSTDNKP